MASFPGLAGNLFGSLTAGLQGAASYLGVREESPEQKSTRVLGLLQKELIEKEGDCSVDIRDYPAEGVLFDNLNDEDKIKFILFGIQEFKKQKRQIIYDRVIDHLSSSRDRGEIFSKMSIDQLKEVFDVAFTEKKKEEEDIDLKDIFKGLPKETRFELAEIYLSNRSYLNRERKALFLFCGGIPSLSKLNTLAPQELENIFFKACEFNTGLVLVFLIGTNSPFNYFDGYACTARNSSPEAMFHLLRSKHRSQIIKGAVKSKDPALLDNLKVAYQKECFFAACEVGDSELVQELVGRFRDESVTSRVLIMRDACKIAKENGFEEIVSIIDSLYSKKEEERARPREGQDLSPRGSSVVDSVGSAVSWGCGVIVSGVRAIASRTTSVHSALGGAARAVVEVVSGQVEEESKRARENIESEIGKIIHNLIKEGEESTVDEKFLEDDYVSLPETEKYQLVLAAIDTNQLSIAKKIVSHIGNSFLQKKFLEACSNGYIDEVQILKDLSCLRSSGPAGDSFMCEGFERACKHNQFEVVKGLGEKIKEELPDKFKEEIDKAIREEREAVLEYFKEIDPSECFYAAIAQGKRGVITKSLVASLANPTLISGMAYASYSGNGEVIDSIVDSTNINIVAKKIIGYTLKQPIKALSTAALFSTSAYFFGIKATLSILTAYEGYQLMRRVKSAVSGTIGASGAFLSRSASIMARIGGISSWLSS